MKNVTITLPDDLARRARIEAARQGKRLSRYVADLLAAQGADASDPLDHLEAFLSGPGYPGVSKLWRGREDLYAEREDDLLRRHQHRRLRSRSGASRKALAGSGFAERDGQKPFAGPKPAKA